MPGGAVVDRWGSHRHAGMAGGAASGSVCGMIAPLALVVVPRLDSGGEPAGSRWAKSTTAGDKRRGLGQGERDDLDPFKGSDPVSGIWRRNAGPGKRVP